MTDIHIPVSAEMDRLVLDLSFKTATADLSVLNKRIEAIGGWNVLTAAALREGLSELIYWCLRGREADLPHASMELLKSRYYSTSARNSMLLREIDRFPELFAGRDFMLLKGAWLVSRVYEAPGLRRFGDIDVLVKPEDMSAIDKSLQCQGYRSVTALIVPQKTSGNTGLNSVVYRNVENTVTIHVHWNLLNSIMPKYMYATLDMSCMWRDSVVVDGFTEMSPEHHLFHLCEHALRHSYERLILVRDMAELCLSRDIDWDRVIDHAERAGFVRALYYGLLLTREKTGISFPEPVIERLNTRQGLFGRRFLNMIRHGKRTGELSVLAYLDSLESIGKRIKFLCKCLFPSRKLLAQAMEKEDNAIGLGCYFVRLLRGARHALRAVCSGV